ncbi:MAG: multiheme c-type cytochrome, partial [Planctomycetota bacterium]
MSPKLRKLLAVVFLLTALLAVNSFYLGGVTLLGWATGEVYEDWFYLVNYLVHLLLGLLIVGPVVWFGIAHLRRTWSRKNRAAVRAGLGTFIAAITLIVTGVLLMRLEGVIVIRHPVVRDVAYWLHVASPFVAAWLFVLHRLAGKKIRWRVGARWAGAGVVLGGGLILLAGMSPRPSGHVGSGEEHFFPALSRTSTGEHIPARVLSNDRYCVECHPDIHASWEKSAHRLASFTNPAYLFSVREVRRVTLERDGSVRAARFCAGCHDPVPLFSGRFDDPEFDDVSDPTAHAGITCTVCHAITHVNTPVGNGDYTIEEPVHYPFALSSSPALRWLSQQLIKGKPAFHRKTFLKPLHKETGFCGTCHKVHLPEELNHYRWLRGQNHKDSFHLSGVSGFGVASFYYPERAEKNCNDCHMPLVPSTDFAARVRDDSGVRKTMDHQYP